MEGDVPSSSDPSEVSDYRVMNSSHLSVVQCEGTIALGGNQVLIDQFSTYQVGRGFSPNTISRRRGTLRRFGTFIAPKRLDRATTTDVEEWLATFRAPRTRHAYRSDLRTFFRWAVSRDLLPLNPTTLVDPVKIPKALPRPIGPEVMAALVTSALRARRMIALGLYAGLRNSEIAGLDASDVDLHNEPPLLIVRNGKGGKDRAIPVHPVLAEMLTGLPTHGPVFPNKEGKPIRPNAVWHTIRTQFQRCGIDATPHQLRHRFGTEAARAANGDLLTVALLMGHESMNTTRGYVGWSGKTAAVVGRMYTTEAA